MGYEVERDRVSARRGLHIHTFGPRGDLLDEGGHFRDAYTLNPGDWLLVRPDGYIGAIVASNEVEPLEDYLRKVGLAAES